MYSVSVPGVIRHHSLHGLLMDTVSLHETEQSWEPSLNWTLTSSTETFKVKFDLRWAVVTMAAQRKPLSSTLKSLTGEKLDFCLLCPEMTALEFWVDFITSLIRFQLWNFNMHYYMQYPTHITTCWIHLLVFSHAQTADRMEFKIGVNEMERSMCAHVEIEAQLRIWSSSIIGPLSFKCGGWQFL